MQKVTKNACFVAKYWSQWGLQGPHPQDTSASSNSVWRLLDFSSDMINLPFSTPLISCNFPFGIEPLLLCCLPQINPFPFAIFGGIIVSASTFPFARIWVSSPAIISFDLIPLFSISFSFSSFTLSHPLPRILPRERILATAQTVRIRTVNLEPINKFFLFLLNYNWLSFSDSLIFLRDEKVRFYHRDKQLFCLLIESLLFYFACEITNLFNDGCNCPTVFVEFRLEIPVLRLILSVPVVYKGRSRVRVSVIDICSRFSLFPLTLNKNLRAILC